MGRGFVFCGRRMRPRTPLAADLRTARRRNSDGRIENLDRDHHRGLADEPGSDGRADGDLDDVALPQRLQLVEELAVAAVFLVGRDPVQGHDAQHRRH